MNDLGMLLGRLLERSEHTATTVERIEVRQVRIGEELAAVKSRIESLEKVKGSDLEKWTKRGVAVAAPVGTLWATGSTEKAIEVLMLLFGGR